MLSNKINEILLRKGAKVLRKVLLNTKMENFTR